MRRFLFIAVVILLSVLIGMRLDSGMFNSPEEVVLVDSDGPSVIEGASLGETIISDVDDSPEGDVEVVPSVVETYEVVSEQEVECDSNLDCFGKRELIRSMCMNGAAVKEYTRYTCLNPGTLESNCVVMAKRDTLVKACDTVNECCSKGECVEYTPVMPVSVHGKYSWAANN